MKKIYLLFLTLLLSFNSFAQLTYQIGSGTSTTSYFPLYYNWEYNYSQTIYTATELSTSGATVGGQITKIKYKPTSSVSTEDWQDWVIYMANTTKTDFSSTSDWVAVSSMTQVFNGQIIANTTANDWIEITLTTPFTWDGTSNIIVAIDENTPGYGNSPDWSGYTLAPASGNKGLYKYRDYTDIDPLNPPTGTRTNTVAQIQFIGNLTPPCTGAPLGGTVSSATQVGCNTTAVSVAPVNPGFPAFTYQWQESDDNGVADPWSDVAGATGLSFTPPSITGTTDMYYRLKTTCSGTGQSAYSDVHTVTIPLGVALPVSNDFTGFTGGNLSTVFPGWEEKTGDGPLTGTTSNWTDSNDLSLPTAKVNLYTDDRKEWIISPTVHIDSISRVRFKAAITNYN